MKKYLFGTLIFTVAFFLGFLTSPVRFTILETGCAGSATMTIYGSSYFENVSLVSAEYEEQEELNKGFNEEIKYYFEEAKNQQILELNEIRALITFQSDDLRRKYCLIKKRNKLLSTVCSASLWHVREFEKQKLSKLK